MIPTSVGKPRGKAEVESVVLSVEGQILAPLRNHSFFSSAELNQTVSEKLRSFNGRLLKKPNTTQRALSETLDRPALKSILEKPYEYAESEKARVNVDYHIELGHPYRSVPYQLVIEKVHNFCYPHYPVHRKFSFLFEALVKPYLKGKCLFFQLEFTQNILHYVGNT